MDETTRADDDAGSLRPDASRPERRWPMALAVLGAIVLQVGVPHRGRLQGWWIFPILETILLVIVIARDPGKIDRRTRAARRSTIALIAVMTLGTMAGVTLLIYDILNFQNLAAEGIDATDLLGRGAAIWFTNVIVFSLWYWELDRGGPAERAAGSGVPPSFAFPENAMPEFAEAGWQPRYPDYLYLAFTNATAFSPTDTLPVRIWAKMAMLVQSAVSLVTAILVIAWSINDLG
ncbi:MAG: hypothetical protein ACXWW5_01405 [Actinomycetota bacterium]